MLAITSGGKGRSLENGFPGAKRIKKKETVISTNIVGMASKTLLRMNLNINPRPVCDKKGKNKALHVFSTCRPEILLFY
jgi:hypothetical protein